MKKYNEGSAEESEEIDEVLPSCNNKDSDVPAITPLKKMQKIPASVELSESDLDGITSLIANSLPTSALSKHL